MNERREKCRRCGESLPPGSEESEISGMCQECLNGGRP